MLAKNMDLPEDCIDMLESDVGGGFGVRGEFYPEDFLIPFAARKLGRPVKWTEDRRENLLASNHSREMDCEIEIACERDGRILALRGKAWVDMGAYMRANGAIPPRNVAQFLSGPYKIANIHMESFALLTHKTPVGTYRGPGRFEADFFRERLFDMAAKDLGIDPVEFRRRNLPSSAGHAVSARHRRPPREKGGARQRRLCEGPRPLPAGIQAGRKEKPAGPADRRPLPRRRASAASSRAARPGRARARAS